MLELVLEKRSAFANHPGVELIIIQLSILSDLTKLHQNRAPPLFPEMMRRARMMMVEVENQPGGIRGIMPLIRIPAQSTLSPRFTNTQFQPLPVLPSDLQSLNCTMCACN